MIRMFLRPKWLLTHLLVIVLVVVMVYLSIWQFQRLDQRKAFNAVVRANSTQQIVSIEKLISSKPADVEWRRVIVRGTFRPAGEVLALNRSQDGAAGLDAVTPLDFKSGGMRYVLIVDRGFIPLGTDVPLAPVGEVEIVGRVRLSQERRVGSLRDPSTGVLGEVQHIDVMRLNKQIRASSDQKVLSFYIDLLHSPQVTTALPARVADPTTNNGSHFSYAVQWLLFSACAIAAWVILVRRALRDSRLASSLVE